MSYTEWQMFDSSSIAAGRYDENTRVLEIQFNEGKIYRYLDVPQAIWLGLCRADSKGRFFQSQIRDRFRHEIKGGGSSAGEYRQPSVQRPPEVKPIPPPSTFKSVSTDNNDNSVKSQIEEAKRYYELALTKISEASSVTDIAEALSILAQSAARDFTPAQSLLALVLLKKGDGRSSIVSLETITQSLKWINRFERSTKGLKNSVETDYTFDPSSPNAGNDYYKLACYMVDPAKPVDDERYLYLMTRAAELNHTNAQLALFMFWGERSKKDPTTASVTEARKWFYRSERSKQGLPNSPATDFTTGREGGGCAGVIVIGFVTTALLCFI